MQPETIPCRSCGKALTLNWKGWSGERGKLGFSPDELDVVQQAEDRHEWECRG